MWNYQRILITSFSIFLASITFAQEIRLSVYTKYPATIDTLSNRPGVFAFMTFFEALMNEAGIPYDISTTPARRAMQLTQTTHNAIAFPIARTTKREAHFNLMGGLVREPIHTYLIKLEERTDIFLTNLESARGYSIGLVGQDYIYEYFLDLGFENLQPVNGCEQNIQKLILGRIDLIVQTGAEIYPVCERTGISCGLLEPVLELISISSGVYLA